MILSISLYNFIQQLYTMAVLKVMPLVLLCWPMMSKADVGDMVVKAEPFHQYSIKFCCHVTDGSRWQSALRLFGKKKKKKTTN